MHREGQGLHHCILVLTLMNYYRYLLKYCVIIIFFYSGKLCHLYVNKTNCVQDEEDLIIEENGKKSKHGE